VQSMTDVRTNQALTVRHHADPEDGFDMGEYMTDPSVDCLDCGHAHRAAKCGTWSGWDGGAPTDLCACSDLVPMPECPPELVEVMA
jgi:hypothetical protein